MNRIPRSHKIDMATSMRDEVLNPMVCRGRMCGRKSLLKATVLVVALAVAIFSAVCIFFGMKLTDDEAEGYRYQAFIQFIRSKTGFAFFISLLVVATFILGIVCHMMYQQRRI